VFLISIKPEEDFSQTIAVCFNSGVTTLQGANTGRHDDTVEQAVLFPYETNTRTDSLLVRAIILALYPSPVLTRNLASGRMTALMGHASCLP
jgi:hypothetical protein